MKYQLFKLIAASFSCTLITMQFLTFNTSTVFAQSQNDAVIFRRPTLRNNRAIDACLAQSKSISDSDCSESAHTIVANKFCEAKGYTRSVKYTKAFFEFEDRYLVTKLLTSGQWYNTEGGFIFTSITCSN